MKIILYIICGLIGANLVIGLSLLNIIQFINFDTFKVIGMIIGALVIIYLIFRVNEMPIQELVNSEVNLNANELELNNELDFNSEDVDPYVPANITALNRLEHLAKSNLIEKGMLKEYYFELGEIFKKYFIDTFDTLYNFDLNSNTDNLLYFVARTYIFGGEYNKEFCQIIEMKAKANSGVEVPTIEQANASLKNIKAFILFTSQIGWCHSSIYYKEI